MGLHSVKSFQNFIFNNLKNVPEGSELPKTKCDAGSKIKEKGGYPAHIASYNWRS